MANQTAAVSPPGPSLPVNQVRLNEIFFMDKCKAHPSESRNIYEWCMNLEPSGNASKPFVASCLGLSRADVICEDVITVVGDGLLTDNETCVLGKPVKANFVYPLTPDRRAEIQQSCYEWYYGSFPWWATLLIVLAIVIAFATAAYLFWVFWLKRRWQEAQKGSTLESRWTESPVSTVSNVSPARAPAPKTFNSPNSMGNVSIGSGSGSKRKTMRSGSIGSGRIGKLSGSGSGRRTSAGRPGMRSSSPSRRALGK